MSAIAEDRSYEFVHDAAALRDAELPVGPSIRRRASYEILPSFVGAAEWNRFDVRQMPPPWSAYWEPPHRSSVAFTRRIP